MSGQKSTNQDLNDLLDSALQDFEKDSQSKGGEQAADTSETASTSNGERDESDEFFVEQTKKFSERMNALLSGGGGAQSAGDDDFQLPADPELVMAGFKKMAEAASLTISGQNTASDEDVSKFSETIAQTLKGLQEGSNGLEASVDELDVTNMFESLNLDMNAEDGDGNAFLPFMEGMMLSLLSADVLLPNINELLEKYPKYLTENADNLSAEDKERYNKQLELYKMIKQDLEGQLPGDSVSVKRQNLDGILNKMNKLQEYGQPPKEVFSEAAGDLPFGDANLLGAAGAGSGPQCPTM